MWDGKMLCATIKQTSYGAIRQACAAADLIELRLDLHRPGNFRELIKASTKPIIFTLKTPSDALFSLAPDYVDLTHTHDPALFASIGKRFPKIKRICSCHDFDKTPDLEKLFVKMKRCPAEIYKISTLAHSINDAFRMLQWVRKHRGIGVCLGDLGVITRILAPIFGSPWTYAPIELKQKTAPGQLLLKDLVETYRYRSLSSKTALFGLIGDPVSESVSHRIYNFTFDRLGLDAIYVKMKVRKDELKTFFPHCFDLGFQGLGVTMPLKEAVRPYLDHCKERAINTIGATTASVVGWNTDGVAALDIIEKRMKVSGKKIFLLGAGGVAIAIAKEAARRKAVLTILNRHVKRAQVITDEVGGVAYPLQEFRAVAKQGYDILVNGTSVGMGEDKRLPVPANYLLENRLVMDVISRPSLTPFLAAAKQKRCRIIKGMELFIQQAVGQFCHWYLNPQGSS